MALTKLPLPFRNTCIFEAAFERMLIQNSFSAVLNNFKDHLFETSGRITNSGNCATRYADQMGMPVDQLRWPPNVICAGQAGSGGCFVSPTTVMYVWCQW